ncbi:MAG: hypothetical protein ACE5JL_08695, partial [Dehalococcoidia bacterium]
MKVLLISIMAPVLLALVLAGCGDESETERHAKVRLGDARNLRAYYLDRVFYPVAPVVRADLLNVQLLEPTTLVLKDREVREGTEGYRVYAIQGVPLEEALLVRIPASGAGTSCTPDGAYIYTTLTAPLPPIGLTPTPSGPQRPTPTPTPPFGP